jgi:hypothetical protein
MTNLKNQIIHQLCFYNEFIIDLLVKNKCKENMRKKAEPKRRGARHADMHLLCLWKMFTAFHQLRKHLSTIFEITKTAFC